MVKYVYDAWGNHAVEVLDSACAELSQLNPYRYRGYYYDTETGLYFLKTRYYDPEVGRFITIDGLTYINLDLINGVNLYAYCKSNPIMRIDPNGTKWLSIGWNWSLFKTTIKNWWNGVKRETVDSLEHIKNFGQHFANFVGGIKDWFSDTVGGYVKTVENIINSGKEFLGFGWESGIDISAIKGDDSKPFSFYFVKPAKWWNFLDYKIGFDINIGKFHYSVGMGLATVNTSIGWENNSFDLFGGVDKIGIGISHSKYNVTEYSQAYIRTLNFVLAVALVASGAGILIPAFASA